MTSTTTQTIVTFDLNEVDQDAAPEGVPATAWSAIFGAAVTARAMGSRGAFTADPVTGVEYAMTFHTKVSDDGWRIKSTTPVTDLAVRVPDAPVHLDNGEAAAWQSGYEAAVLTQLGLCR